MVDESKQSRYQPRGRWIRKEKRLAIYLRDNFYCLICKKDLTGESAQDITLDHIVTKQNGGSNDPTNLFTCCRSCNSSRSCKGLEEFVEDKERLLIIQAKVNHELTPYLRHAKKILVGRLLSKVVESVVRKPSECN